MPTDAVLRELLVRHLETWLPGALHRARRATVALAYADGDVGSAEAALRVVAEYADRLRGRRLTVLVLGDGTEQLPARLGPVEAELPAEAAVHLVPGTPARLPVALKAAGAAGAPLLSYVDGPAALDPAVLTAAAAGRPAEVLVTAAGDAPAAGSNPLLVTEAGHAPPAGAGPLLVTEAGHAPPAGAGSAEAPIGVDPGGGALAGPAGGVPAAGRSARVALADAGFPLVAEVELVPADGTAARRLAFGTASDKSLEAFKEALWAVDEFAGVRYRDPADPAGRLLDIALAPEPGPLRRELLAELARSGPRTVTELRRHTLTSTVYRSGDALRALTGLLASGAVTRDPAHGRLGGDVVIAAARPGSAV